MLLRFSVFLTVLIFKDVSAKPESCNLDSAQDSCAESTLLYSRYKQKRYLLYDVNPGEGFNLRRDVYMRIASVVKQLNEGSKSIEWILILPPWGPLYHWKTRNIGYQAQIKWSKFFDVPSLHSYVPVMELEDFLNEYGSQINILYYLQHYAEGWEDGVWNERTDIRECVDAIPYRIDKYGKVTGWFWDYENIFAEKLFCLSIQGYSSTLKRFLESSNFSSIMIDRSEVILHDAFGDKEYWMVRRSMGFSKNLIAIGDSFRKLYLNSNDKDDKTEKRYNNLTSPIKRKAVGGPYVAVHLRRQDFVKARPKEVPSIAHAAQQILKHMKRLSLDKLFVATDATDLEFKELLQYIPGAVRFKPSKEVLKDILDGGVAIVDQWICAHSRFFIGSYESTFSFRIQEEREILGFPVEQTFNRLCGDNKTFCAQPSKWTINFQ